jgi:inorganic pyrophosphatase
MNLDKIEAGKNCPDEFNVVIEIQSGVPPVKYEVDKNSGALFVDRLVATSMVYPTHYGYIPQTLGLDGDPLDVLLVANFPVIPGSVVKCRPIGVINMSDEKGRDEKIICVPVSKVTAYYDNVRSYKDLPEILIKQIVHFFEEYKKLEPGKWVKIDSTEDIEVAKQIIIDAVKRY